MRLQLDEIISELESRVGETRGLRNRVLLKKALKALQDYRKETRKMV